jgi:hypothetical protein
MLAAATQAAAPPPAEWKLTAGDRHFLDGLFTFVVDPTGADRVEIVTLARTVWAQVGPLPKACWRFPGGDRKPARFVGIDGSPLLSFAGARPIDFVRACRERLPAPTFDDIPRLRGSLRRTAVGDFDTPDVVLAPWLYRLGHEGPAARHLYRVENRAEAVAALRGQMAWSHFAAAAHAYMMRADEEALAHGERLLRLYPEEARVHGAAALVDDLRRRKKAGTFGKASRFPPPALARMPKGKQAEVLISMLDEVDARQRGQPGWVNLAADPRVRALIELGDDAVPALIDAVEKDTRLTRSVHFWRDFAPSRTVLGAHEAALAALMSILRLSAFEPRATGDNFTARGEEGRREVVGVLRAYWKQYGRLPFAKRMMTILTDAKAGPEAWREAAQNLTRPGWRMGRYWALFARVAFGTLEPRRGGGEAVTFERPTAAEAILAAMDRDIVQDDAKKDVARRDGSAAITNFYLARLVELGDPRILRELHRRVAGAGPKTRLELAAACRTMGSSAAMIAYARDFEKGEVSRESLEDAVRELTVAGLPECDRALMAMAKAGHFGHATARAEVVRERGWPERGPWQSHPFCLPLLAAELDGRTETRTTYTIRAGRLECSRGAVLAWEDIPEIISDPASRNGTAKERIRDRAAEMLARVVIGVPKSHPLLKDNADRLKRLKAFMTAREGRFRKAAEFEVWVTGASEGKVIFIPDISPLGRAATEADVKAGRAVFHLSGKGKVVKAPSPAAVEVGGEYGLVVQAEADGEGSVHYGVIFRHSIRRVDARDARAVTPDEKR